MTKRNHDVGCKGPSLTALERKQQIFAWLQVRESATTKEVSTTFNISITCAASILDELRDEELVKQIGSRRQATWEVM